MDRLQSVFGQIESEARAYDRAVCKEGETKTCAEKSWKPPAHPSRINEFHLSTPAAHSQHRLCTPTLRAFCTPVPQTASPVHTHTAVSGATLDLHRLVPPCTTNTPRSPFSTRPLRPPSPCALHGPHSHNLLLQAALRPPVSTKSHSPAAPISTSPKPPELNPT